MAETQNVMATFKKKIKGVVYKLNIKSTADAISYEDTTVKNVLDDIMASQNKDEASTTIDVITEDDLQTLSADNCGEFKILRKDEEDDKLLLIVPDSKNDKKFSCLLVGTSKFTIPTKNTEQTEELPKRKSE